MIRLLILTLLWGLSAPPSRADLASGIEAYHEGEYETARRELGRAAEDGDPDAQSKFGVLYAKGLGGAQDYAEAAKWFRRAAEQGYAKGQFNLGIVFSEGQGVPRDEREAVKWFEKAAKQGFVESQIALGGMYHKGRGVPQDYVRAFAWVSVAAASGSEVAIDVRELIRSKLRTGQVDAGRKLARQLYEKYPPRD